MPSEQRCAMNSPLSPNPPAKNSPAKTSRITCSHTIRRRISAPNTMRARNADVAISTKAHSGSAQTKIRIAGVTRSRSFAATLSNGTSSDRKSVVEGKSVSVRVELGGRSNIKKKKKEETDNMRSKQLLKYK